MSSAESCHHAVFLSFPLDGLSDLDSEEEDDEDENIAIQTESKSTHAKRFTLDILAHRWRGWVWQHITFIKVSVTEKLAPPPAGDLNDPAVCLE